MRLKSLCTALLLAFLTTNAMGYTSPGIYFIVNRATAPRGPLLALSFSGENEPAMIAPKTRSLLQQWIITDAVDGNGQSVLTASAPTLEMARAGNTLVTAPAGFQVWYINPTLDGYYHITNPGGGDIWGVTSTDSGSPVVLGTMFGEKGEWIIEAI